MSYSVQFSIKRNGWCIFKVNDQLSLKYHAGPFSEQAVADSEVRRLQGLLDNGSHVGTKEVSNGR